MGRITKQMHIDAMRAQWNTAYEQGINTGKRQAFESANGQMFQARIKMAESMAKMAEANAQLATAVNRMMDEGLFK